MIGLRYTEVFQGENSTRMACAPSVKCTMSEEHRAAVRKLFIEFVKPCNVLQQFYSTLTKEEFDSVMATTSSKGDSIGAKYLFSKLEQKNCWFPNLLKVLRDQDVKLQHVANIMEKEVQQLKVNTVNGFRRIGASALSASSHYIEYNRNLVNSIRKLFLKLVKPESVLHVFNACDDNVLTIFDIENVKAQVNNFGSSEGTVLLLERLVLYENWFPVLMKVLRNPEVELDYVADGMEKDTNKIRLQYMAETRTVNEEYESDGTEMKSVADGLPLRSPEAVARTESYGHPLVGVGASIDGYGSSREPTQLGQVRGASVNRPEKLVQALDSVDNDDSSAETQPFAAAKAGDTELLMVLLTKTSDINWQSSKGYTALMCAALKGHTECVHLFIVNGCDVHRMTNDGDTALMIAAKANHSACVQLLINGGANVDAARIDGTTALMLAAREGYADCVRLLLQNHCNPDKLHKDGRTALMYAAYKGHSDCVKLLIDFHCNVNMTDNNGSTPLMFAVTGDHTRCMEQLLDAKAEIDKPGQYNSTAVMLAVVYNRIQCLKLLISRRANLNIPNRNQETPLKYARRNGHSECVELIRGASKQNTHKK